MSEIIWVESINNNLFGKNLIKVITLPKNIKIKNPLIDWIEFLVINDIKLARTLKVIRSIRSIPILSSMNSYIVYGFLTNRSELWTIMYIF